MAAVSSLMPRRLPGRGRPVVCMVDLIEPGVATVPFRVGWRAVTGPGPSRPLDVVAREATEPPFDQGAFFREEGSWCGPRPKVGAAHSLARRL